MTEKTHRRINGLQFNQHNSVTIQQSLDQKITWNTKEYEVKSIDEDKGELILVKKD